LTFPRRLTHPMATACLSACNRIRGDGSRQNLVAFQEETSQTPCGASGSPWRSKQTPEEGSPRQRTAFAETYRWKYLSVRIGRLPERQRKRRHLGHELRGSPLRRLDGIPRMRHSQLRSGHDWARTRRP
jgi:hypothetical protein